LIMQILSPFWSSPSLPDVAELHISDGMSSWMF
jgi:hypothetical protein